MDAVDAALAALPQAIVIRDPDIIRRYVTDFRQQYAGASRALLRPRSVAEVQEVARAFHARGVPLVPQAGNTGYCAGATPDRDGSEVVISLERLNRIREIDAGNLSMTVDAGCILAALQQAAAEAGLLLPLSLGAQQSCQIGGNLSTNAGGVAVVRHGMARDLVLGLEVVLADGRLFNDLAPLRKKNAGYDIKQVFIGAEGTLGIITGASLRLARQPRQTVTAFLAIDDAARLPDLLDRAQILTGEAITSFEYISGRSLQLLLNHKPELRSPLAEAAPHYLLVEAATPSPLLDLTGAVETLLAEVMAEGAVTDGVLAASESQRQELWHLRESLPEGETMAGGSVKHDVSVRTSDLAGFLARAADLVRAQAPEALLSVYGHVGDGNVHFNIVPTPGTDPAPVRARIMAEVSPLIHRLAVEMGGSFSAEYGIGRTKRALLAEHGDPVKLELMRALKEAFDPAGLLNPGKVLPESGPGLARRSAAE